MAFKNLLLFLFLIPISFNSANTDTPKSPLLFSLNPLNAGIPQRPPLLSLNSVKAGIPKAASYPNMLNYFRSREQTNLYSPPLGYALNSARRLTSSAAGAWLKQQRINSAVQPNNLENNSLIQNNVNNIDVEHEKEIVEYKKVLEKIKELEKDIDRLKKHANSHEKMEAKYEKLIKDYLDAKRNLLLCTQEKKLWHEARLAKLRNQKALKARERCLIDMLKAEAKFSAEVKKCTQNRELLQQQKEEEKHERMIALYCPFS